MTINNFDNGITSAVQSWPSWLHPLMVAASFMADPQTMIVLVIAIVVAAWRRHLTPIAAAFAWTLPAMGLNGLLKHFLHRARPDTIYVSNMPFHTYSFPSGHAFCATLFYGLIGYLALRHLPGPWGAVVMVALIALILLVGISRVYLGAHFPTDVLGGWILGFIALVIIILAVRL